MVRHHIPAVTLTEDSFSWKGLLSKDSARVQKSLGVHKILVRKIWFNPPRKGLKTREKLYKSVENLQIDTFSGGGDTTILWTSGRF